MLGPPLAAVLLAQAAGMATPPPLGAPMLQADGRVVEGPQWRKRPTEADYDQALARHIAHPKRLMPVTAYCEAEADGGFGSCQVRVDDGAPEGLEDAALAVATKYAVAPLTPAGESVAGRVFVLPMAFMLEARVRVACRVTATYGHEDCKVLSVEPAPSGPEVAEDALAAAHAMRRKPGEQGSGAVAPGQTVSFRVTIKLRPANMLCPRRKDTEECDPALKDHAHTLMAAMMERALIEGRIPERPEAGTNVP